MNPNRFQEASFSDIPAQEPGFRIETPFLDVPETELKPPYFLSHVLDRAFVPLAEGMDEKNDRKIKPECQRTLWMILKGIEKLLRTKMRNQRKGSLLVESKHDREDEKKERELLNFITEVIGFHVYTGVRNAYKKAGINPESYNNKNIFGAAWNYLELNADEIERLYAAGIEKLERIIQQHNDIRSRYREKIDQLDGKKAQGRPREEKAYILLPPLSKLIEYEQRPLITGENIFLQKIDNRYLRRKKGICPSIADILVQADKQGAWDQIRVFLDATPVIELTEKIFESFELNFLRSLRRYFFDHGAKELRVIARDTEGNPIGVHNILNNSLLEYDFTDGEKIIRIAALQMTASLYIHGEITELSIQDIERFHSDLVKAKKISSDEWQKYDASDEWEDYVSMDQIYQLSFTEAQKMISSLRDTLGQSRFFYLFLEPKEEYGFFSTKKEKVFICHHPELKKMNKYLIINLSDERKIEMTLVGRRASFDRERDAIAGGSWKPQVVDRAYRNDDGQGIIVESKDEMSSQNIFIERMIKSLREYCVERESWAEKENDRRRSTLEHTLVDCDRLQDQYPELKNIRKAFEETIPEAISTDHTLRRPMTSEEFELFGEHARYALEQFAQEDLDKLSDLDKANTIGLHLTPKELITADFLRNHLKTKRKGTPSAIDKMKIRKGLSELERAEIERIAFRNIPPREKPMDSSRKIADILPKKIQSEDLEMIFDFEPKEMIDFIYDIFHFPEILGIKNEALNEALHDVIFFLWIIKKDSGQKQHTPDEIEKFYEERSGSQYLRHILCIQKDSFDKEILNNPEEEKSKKSESIIEIRRHHAAYFLRNALRWLSQKPPKHKEFFQLVENLPKSIWYFPEVQNWDNIKRPGSSRMDSQYKKFKKLLTNRADESEEPYKRQYEDLKAELEKAKNDLRDARRNGREEEWLDKFFDSYEFLKDEYRPEQLKAFAEAEIEEIRKGIEEFDPLNLAISGLMPERIENEIYETVYADDKSAKIFKEHLLGMNDDDFDKFLRRFDLGLGKSNALFELLMNLFFKLQENLKTNERKCLALMNAFSFYEVALHASNNEDSEEFAAQFISEFFLLKLKAWGQATFGRALDFYFRKMGVDEDSGIKQ